MLVNSKNDSSCIHECSNVAGHIQLKSVCAQITDSWFGHTVIKTLWYQIMVLHYDNDQFKPFFIQRHAIRRILHIFCPVVYFKVKTQLFCANIFLPPDHFFSHSSRKTHISVLLRIYFSLTATSRNLPLGNAAGKVLADSLLRSPLPHQSLWWSKKPHYHRHHLRLRWMCRVP